MLSWLQISETDAILEKEYVNDAYRRENCVDLSVVLEKMHYTFMFHVWNPHLVDGLADLLFSYIVDVIFLNIFLKNYAFGIQKKLHEHIDEKLVE